MCYLPDEAGDGLHVHEQQADMPGSGRAIPTLAYGYASQAQGPVVIVLHAIFGPGSFERDVARRLAQAGFAVLLPDLFCREGPLAEPSFEAALARNSRHHAPRAMEDIAVIVRHLSETGRSGSSGFVWAAPMLFLPPRAFRSSRQAGVPWLSDQHPSIAQQSGQPHRRS